jgi:hypothetical protein
MSKDLGAVAAGSKGANAMLSALATLGLPTPVVAKPRGNQSSGVEQEDTSTSGSDEDDKEVRGKEVRAAVESTCSSSFLQHVACV